jgi:hypothetical protein
MTANYKQLAKELYEALKQVKYCSLVKNIHISPEIDNVLQKYEQEVDRGTGRTTALYMKAITEALENPGKSVEFIDHHPHRWDSAQHHASNLMHIIKKLGLDIVVTTPAGSNQVFIYNRFGK